MNAIQSGYIDAAIHASGFGDADKACIEQAKGKLVEWRSDVVSGLMDYLRGDQSLLDSLEEQGVSMASFESLALEWYDRLISGVYGDDYWGDLWLLGLHALNADWEVSQIIGVGTYVSGDLQRRIFETYREGSAVAVAHAMGSLISSSMTVAAESAYYELFACVQRAGITKPIIQRMIKIEVNSKK